MPRSMTMDQSITEPPTFLAQDPAGDSWAVVSLEQLLRQDGRVRGRLVPQRSRTHPGETPIFGEVAVARWVALHDRACDLRAAPDCSFT
jgi:hypothetical protein